MVNDIKSAADRRISTYETWEAVQSIFYAISKIAGVMIVAFGFAYLTGWEVAASYFSVLGAGWAVRLLTSYQVIDFGYYVVATFSVTTVLQLEALLTGISRPLAIQRLGVVVLIISSLLGIISLRPLSIISTSASIFALYADSLAWSVLTGIIVGQSIVVVAISRDIRRVNSIFWGGLSLILMLIVLWAPMQWGEASAKSIDCKIKAAPEILFPGSLRSCELINPVGDRLLVRCKESSTNKYWFSLISPSNKTYIESEL